MKAKRPGQLVLLLVAVLGILTVFVSACSSSKDEAGGTGGQATASPGDTTGVTDTSIKIGTLQPITGVAASWGIPYSKGMKAYFDYINDQGGIYGRKLVLDVGDSQYSGPMGSEAARKLIDQDKVFAFVGNLGTGVEAAVTQYIDQDNIPDLFVLSGASQFIDPVQKNRFTAMVDYTTEGKIFATYLADTYPGKKLGILAQNDDYGKEGEAGTKQGLEDLGSDIETTTEYYDASMTDVTSQMQRLKGDNVDVIMFWGGPLQAANMMKTARETLNWDVPMLINQANAGATLGALSGWDNIEGVVSTSITMNTDVTSTVPGIVSRREIAAKYAPDVPWDSMVFAGYSTAESLVGLLKQAGKDLSRESLVAAAESVCKFSSDISMVPESTSPTDHSFVQAQVFVKAQVDRSGPSPLVDWVPFGDAVDFESTKDCKVPTPPADAEGQPGPPLGGE
jgi:branched-chain amino acid transport system substrate-binding protein